MKGTDISREQEARPVAAGEAATDARTAVPVTFDDLYRTYRQRVFVYCLQILRDRQLAEDTFQDIFLKVFRHEKSLAAKENIAAWIFTVARNTCLNALRDRGIAQRYVEYVEPEALMMHPAGMPAVESDVKDFIEWALTKLPADQREAIVLREFHEFTYEQIARITGTNINNVKVRIFRARQRLRKILGPILKDDVGYEHDKR